MKWWKTIFPSFCIFFFNFISDWAGIVLHRSRECTRFMIEYFFCVFDYYSLLFFLVLKVLELLIIRLLAPQKTNLYNLATAIGSGAKKTSSMSYLGYRTENVTCTLRKKKKKRQTHMRFYYFLTSWFMPIWTIRWAWIKEPHGSWLPFINESTRPGHQTLRWTVYGPGKQGWLPPCFLSSVICCSVWIKTEKITII